MVKGLFTTTSTHKDIASSSEIIVCNTNFIKCIASKGGAFFSESIVNHIVKYCYFAYCEATDGNEGRGGAFFIHSNGTADIIFCCAEQCTSQFGSDLMAWGVSDIHFIHVTSIRSWNNHHSLFITCKNNVNLNNINATLCITNNKEQNVGYGNGVNLYIYDPPQNLKFLNLIENSGEASALELESATNKCVEISYLNIINNKNADSYFSFFKGSDSSIILKKSSFLGNQGNKILSYHMTDNNNFHASFESCLFQIQKVEESHILYDDYCLFNQETVPTLSDIQQCHFQFFYSCKQNGKGNTIIKPIVFLICCLYE